MEALHCEEPIRFVSGNAYSLDLDYLIEKTDGVDLQAYDIYVVFLSGGKDSVACLLELIEQGIPRDKIECHHHLIDGEGPEFMDWPCTEEYCKALCKALGVKLYFSWKEGGFLREMERDNAPTAAVLFETPEGETKKVGGDSDKLGTRKQFPALSADLRVRWCSAYLKVDVGKKVISHQKRFEGKRTLVLTGERAEESPSRARYASFEPHASSSTKVAQKDAQGQKRIGRDGKVIFDIKRNKKRFVDHYRIIQDWEEERVWDLMKKYRILPHPAYILGFGRCSCLICIFASANQLATIQSFMPNRFENIEAVEAKYGKTIHFSRNSDKEVVQIPLAEVAAKGTPYQVDKKWLEIAMNRGTFAHDIIVDNWELPAGAFGDSCGPT
ncbi:phosphoadenosine phosphosulfate reductase family protein [Pseudoalteromonas sp. CST5]|uniref:phosphoadenosine phosphosulfate reductase family protein n=1 Tax=unclassified Pseudoalteromonas TaxID=194690 RepID=UPI00235A3EDD|nr:MULTISPECIES: phosphoadenosine phosphosulfate reductase family protein [unclassified Pseudoalteromonas]MDC9514416.1 phosphoadenosine phosphosulfate reductase family protein [Pseudoalteromonas sp. CST1]MDC9538862.1 phosphoadenosine phosphosulfate reductase family protein [Pseudoalteromonas sp. CST3]MDC9543111.1 phosphoadenosine phosphosulfate reductase family protein [Pseudoalteromonas sp. CST2]MDC9545814.1 phosphoadenosine phosphosulfate reductase family protein [Pseudoalteromonas sp. CST4]